MVSIEDKKTAILKAVNIFSKRQIDVFGKGKSIARLEKGEKVGLEKIEEMYNRVLVLERQPDKKEIKTTNKDNQKYVEKKDNEKTTDKDKVDKYRDKLHELEEDNVRLKAEMKELQQVLVEMRRKVESLENKSTVLEEKVIASGKGKEANKTKLPRERHSEKVHGFSIIQKSTSTGGRVYHKWYAHRRIDNKQHWVYLGNDALDAEKTVRFWLRENYPALLDEARQLGEST